MDMKKLNFDSRSIHSEREEKEKSKERNDTVPTTTPIHPTASYLFENTTEASELFSLEKKGDIYSRISNPTTRTFEKRVADLENGVGAVATSSGMGAINLIVSSLVDEEENIVSSSNLYGGTYTLFTQRLPEFGIEVRLLEKENDIADKIDEDTKLVHFETIGNPSLEIPDFDKITSIAHENGVPVVIDNTFATPYLCNPIEHGADIVWHSTTKWINGHANAIGGIVIDSGEFDWKKNGFKNLFEPDESYHGLSFEKRFGNEAFIEYCRAKGLRDFGASPSPFNSFLNLTGLETLSLRMDKHCRNSEKIVDFLGEHPKVEWVRYPGLSDHPSRDNAKNYLRNGYGAVITFGLKGGYDSCKKLIEEVELISFSANLGDTKSLIIHPSSTIHSQLSEEEKRKSGVSDDLIRLSVGIEDPRDIKKDLHEALSKV